MTTKPNKDVPPASCPSPQELLAFDTGNLAASRTREVTAHVQSCQACLASHLRDNDDDSRRIRQILVEATESLEDTTTYLRETEYVQLRQRLLEKPEPVADGKLLAELVGTATPSSWPRALPHRLGNYQLLSEIGQGAMGVVYRAEHVSLKRVVALKLLTPGWISKSQALVRFHREMEAIGRLNHPHIVTAHDAGQVEDCHFLVTEYVEGFDLSTLVGRLGPLPLAEACELVRQAALGLEAAHQQQMVHQDVKPSNLMVTPQGQVKVLDLGLVSFLSETSDDELAGETQMGTPDYMAPERWTNPRHVDIRADVYSLGCTLFKLLVGYAPFSQRLQTVDDKAAHLWEAVPSLRRQRAEIPAELERAVYRMLAKSPDDRYATPAAVAEVLKPFAQGARLGELVSAPSGGHSLRGLAPHPTEEFAPTAQPPLENSRVDCCGRSPGRLAAGHDDLRRDQCGDRRDHSQPG